MKALQRRRADVIAAMGAFELEPTHENVARMDRAWRFYRCEVGLEVLVMGVAVALTRAVGEHPAGALGVIVPAFSAPGTLAVAIDGIAPDEDTPGTIVEAPVASLRRVPYSWE